MIDKKGKNIFYILLSINIIATIAERILPALFLDVTKYLPELLVSIIILICWFYAISKGYKWPKVILIIAGFIGAFKSISNAWNIYSIKEVYYDGIAITNNINEVNIFCYALFISGLIYLTTSLFFLFSTSLKSFLNWKNSYISILPKRERLANSIRGIGIIISLVGVSWGFSIGLINTIMNPKLL
jgi:hypothetical protein